MREDFQQFWEYFYPACAAKFLDQWCTRTMRSKIEPMKKVAKTLRRHRELILNWFFLSEDLHGAFCDFPSLLVDLGHCGR